MQRLVLAGWGFQRVNLRRALFVSALALAAAARAGDDKSATPVEQYQALLKEYQTASSGNVRTDEERMKFVGQTYKLRNKLALQFIELAEKHPNDPVAVDALMQAIWQVNGTPWPVELVGRDEATPRACALLQRDYIRSEKLGPACLRLSYGLCREYEPLLRAVLAKNPHRDVQAQACLALARLLTNRLQRIDITRQQPQRAREFADLFGKEYLATLQRQGRAASEKEAGAVFERAVREFGDVKMSEAEGTVGEKAEGDLFEMRHLAVGKEAPDIEGEDQDGQKFKLSDYRGKVVLLDFWSEY
jgi:hypothetical protein